MCNNGGSVSIEDERQRRMGLGGILPAGGKKGIVECVTPAVLRGKSSKLLLLLSSFLLFLSSFASSKRSVGMVGGRQVVLGSPYRRMSVGEPCQSLMVFNNALGIR